MEIQTVLLEEILNDNGITGVRIPGGTRCDVQIGTAGSANLIPIGRFTTESDLVMRVLGHVIDPASGKKVGITGIVTTEQAIMREPEPYENNGLRKFWFLQFMYGAQRAEACKLACSDPNLHYAIRSIAQVSPSSVVEMFVTVLFTDVP